MPQQPATSFADDLASVRSDFDADVQSARDAIGKGEAVPHPVVQRILDWLPTLGGAAGGVAGAMLGAPALGIGALPGGIAGAALGGATGQAVENLGNALVGNPAPATVPEALGSVGTAGLAQGAMEAIGGGLTAGAGKVGAGLMQSAVKPGVRTTMKAIAQGVPTEHLPVVKTLLQEGVNVTPGGIAKLNRIITATNAEISSAVRNLPGKVSPKQAVRHVADVERRAAAQVNPGADVNAVQAVRNEFLKTYPKPLGLSKAQALKQGTYENLSQKAYGELKQPTIEAQKAIARGLKEDIEAEAAKSGVNLAPINAREGGAIQAKEAVAARLAAAGNRDPVSLAWLSHNPATGLAFILERSPGVKSMLARGLYQSAARVTGYPQNVLRLLVASIASTPEESP